MSRDNDAYIAMATALTETGQFARVLRGRQPAELETAGQDLPRAWVCPAGWKEDSLSDPETKQRLVRFQVGLTIDSTHFGEPEEELDRLANVAQNVIGGSDFGFCLPHLTRVNEGVFPSNEVYPRLTLVLKGTFGYLLSGDDTRSTESEL
jgi:hypothetical protein